jgi:uncharacterized cupin superfamily protein
MPPAWVDAPAGTPHPWQREADAGELEFREPAARPANIVNLADVDEDPEPRSRYSGVWRELGRAAGSLRTGLNHVELSRGALGSPLHCHSAEEELFVVLDGDGTLLLGDERIPVQRGHVVARPPGTRVAHALEAGGAGMTYLAYGTREPNDIAYYPRSQKIYFRGVGLMTRVEKLDYWDGEA